MGVEVGEEQATMEAGIAAMENFFRSIHMPTNLRELGVEPTDEQIEHMAKGCFAACGGPGGDVMPLQVEDMIAIYRNAR
jgi:alcohol dehydrogenase class IV